MSGAINEILETFDSLPDKEKKDLASEIIRRSALLDWPPLTDEELTHIANDLFLELDKAEAADARAKSR